MLEERMFLTVFRNKSSNYWKKRIGKFLCLFVCICKISSLMLWPHFMCTHTYMYALHASFESVKLLHK